MEKKKKNLILVSLDTVRADVAYSGRFKFFNALRRNSVTFENVISSSPLTPVSHATVLTGLQPFHHGIRHLFREQIKLSVPTVAEILKAAGYSTQAIVSCPGMNQWYGFSRGFDLYDDEIPLLADGSDPLLTVDVKKRGTALKRADLVTARALELMAATPKPFFLFLHFFDAHWPYEAPEVFEGANCYEEEVAYSLHYLEEFLGDMKKRGRMETTSLMIFSDHGEDLNGLYQNDRGGADLGHPEECGHGCLLYNQTQRTVWIMQDSSLQAVGLFTDQVRLVDITPTILDLLGIEASAKFDGCSVLPLVRGDSTHVPVAYSETFYPEEQRDATGGEFADARNKKAVTIGNRYKVILHLDSDTVEVYDLQSDPLERTNLMNDAAASGRK